MNGGSLSLVAILGFACLLIERIFYYKSKYKKRNEEAENPSHGERIAALEKGQEKLEQSNDKDHGLIRKDISKLFTLLNGMRQ